MLPPLIHESIGDHPPQQLANVLGVTSIGICMMGFGPGLHLYLPCRGQGEICTVNFPFTGALLLLGWK